MQRKLISILVGLGLVASICVACTPAEPDASPALIRGEDVPFQALRDLPARPPSLSMNDVPLNPYMIDWRTGESQQLSPTESIHGIDRIVVNRELLAELTNSAVPSTFTVGVYPNGIEDIDPSIPPEAEYDCLSDSICALHATDALTADLTGLFPDSSDRAVFVIQATYFAEQDGTPFANSIAWVFEAAR